MGRKGFLTDRRVKAAAGAYGKITLLSVPLHKSQIDFIKACRMQNILYGSLRIRGESHTAREIIAGAGGYVSEDDPGKVPDSVQDLIDGTVAADRDQGQAFPAGGDIPGQLGGVP